MNLADYISAGYYITTYTYRDKAALIPERVLDFGCLGHFIPDVGWKLETAEPFCINSPDLAEINFFLENAFIEDKIGFDKIWYSIVDVQAFLKKLGAKINEPMILGLGFHRTLVQDLQSQLALEPDYPHTKYGIYNSLLRNQPLAASGNALGYEVLGLGTNIDHSMYCYDSLISEQYEKHQLSLNEIGLYQNFEDARIVADAANQEVIGNCRWYPFLVIDYTIEKAND